MSCFCREGNSKSDDEQDPQRLPLMEGGTSDRSINKPHSESLNQNETPSPRTIPVKWPANGAVTAEWAQQLGRIFEWASRNLKPSEFPRVVPVNVFDSLVMAASKILHKEPNCLHIDVPSDCSVVIVGDLHGQLHDLLYLLGDAGFPSPNRLFVFNGDYVDRGAWGLETFLLLLAWKIALPHRVFLLRGNHESKFCTSVYGFEQEVMAKYEDQGKHVYRKCLGCFEGLPLASILSGCVYTAHGGLFRAQEMPSGKRPKGKKGRRFVSVAAPKALSLGSLDELARARRGVLDPPWEGVNLIPGDVLWSDPSPRNGLSPNKERGIGLLWGPDSTEEFLRKNRLKLIVRSHEGPDAREKRPELEGMQKGYTIDHIVESGKLITLFSAPDYPQFQRSSD
eukprot:TRINITY_DN1029_c0_g1_i4.p1 TRINITY_DN1029_c0_g1~~TRINITY_DN1029_c0_g1_i4.p1  ORF type:complete len:395 (-),score=59.49 TRINITY_DN1029_c0_g1_i4:415-1599(-)